MTGTEKSAIRTESIAKRFGGFLAVDGVTLDVAERSSFGLLGTNGAGKSTLIRMLTTLTAPTSGTGVVAGHDIRRDPAGVRRSIGVIPQALTSDPELTAEENLNFYARLYGLSGGVRRRAVSELLAAVDLHDWRDKLVGTFSGGMRRRLEIGRALLHRPRILFLDEPTTGLDPASRLAMWEMIRTLQSESGLTLFLTTHYMEEADQLCDEIAIIDHGRIIALDTPAKLKAQLASAHLLEVRFEAPPESWAETLRGLPQVLEIEAGEVWRIQTQDSVETTAALLREAEARAVKIESLAVRASTLEDVFVTFTGRDLRDGVGSAAREISHLYDNTP